MTVAVDCQDAAARPQQPTMSGNWHLRLATLLVTLRGCLMGPDRDFFDKVHASAHKREIPTQHFFSFALDILRQHKPELEDDFREVFRLRNASRRRARQHKVGTLRSSKSESELKQVTTQRGSAMSRSCEDVAAQARSAEEVDETMFRLQALCVQASADKDKSVLTKRLSEINICEAYEQKRKTSFSKYGIDILGSSPP